MTATAKATVPCPEQVYSDLKNLIHHLVRQFQNRHGGDYDELVSEANLLFVQACRTYDPKRGFKIITHVYTRIYYGLLNTLERKGFISYAPRDLQRCDIQLDQLPARVAPSGLSRLLKDLSGDAKTVIKLAMSASHCGPRSAKRRVIGLLKEAGWTMRQVYCCFDEVREALAS